MSRCTIQTILRRTGDSHLPHMIVNSKKNQLVKISVENSLDSLVCSSQIESGNAQIQISHWSIAVSASPHNVTCPSRSAILFCHSKSSETLVRKSHLFFSSTNLYNNTTVDHILPPFGVPLHTHSDHRQGLLYPLFILPFF